MGLVASILPYVVTGLGFLVILLLVVLCILLVMILRHERPEWEASDLEAAREALAVKRIPNSRSHWRAAPEPTWSDPAAVATVVGKMASLGFRKAGTFVHTGREVVIVLFAIPEHRAAGWIQENEGGEIDLTVCSWAEGGAPVRVSTVKNEAAFVLLDGERRKVWASREPADLCRELVRLREGLVLYPVAVENVVDFLNREERQRARCLTADPETAEIWERHLLKAGATDGETGEKIPGKVLRSVYLSQLGDTITDCCLESFAEMTRITAADWTRVQDRFLVIHDRLSTKELGKLGVCEELSREERKRLKTVLRKEVPARQAFEAMNAVLPQHLRFTEVGRVSDPIEATVYLAA